MYTASLLILFMGVALVAGLPQIQEDIENVVREKFVCPEESGSFEDKYQCDKYWVCSLGRATAKLCDDGLVFDIFKANAGLVDPCESPYVVDCGSRSQLQEPSYTSENCPRRNGIFADPDPTVCNRFYTCVKGHAVKTDCSPGLHFDERNGNCAWPKTSGRKNCREDVKSCLGNFCCNGTEVLTPDGVKLAHPTFPNLDDCQRFYVCHNGKTPQESACSLGQVYNELTMMCDYPENVAECEGWYINHPQFADYYEYIDYPENAETAPKSAGASRP